MLKETDGGTGIQTGWLDPDGYLHPCGVTEHMDVAKALVEQYGVPVETGEQEDDALSKTGWCRVTRQLVHGKCTIAFPMDVRSKSGAHVYARGKTSLAQKIYIRELFENNPEAFDDVTVMVLTELDIIDGQTFNEWYARRRR